jgi:peptidoglycan/LPS O-acetylase OafA/YrhL
MVISRVRLLLVPFVIWTAVRFVLIRRLPYNLDEVLDLYHWIPLLIQFYLVSPLLVAFAKRNWKLLLLLTALLGWGLAALSYVEELGSAPALPLVGRLPNWLIVVNFPFWFPMGIVAGLYLLQYRPTLIRYRWHLLVASVVMAILVLAEYQWADSLNGPAWLGPGFGGVTKFPYSLAVILCFLAFDKSHLPYASELSHLGAKSLGIYLGNIPSVYVAALLMYHVTPALLRYQLIYFAVLILVGIGVPLLLMEGVRRSPVHHRYRILFG